MTSPVLLLNEDLDAPVLFSSEMGEVAYFSRRCPGSESKNEDSALVFAVPGGLILAVADGAGGGMEGDRASCLAIEAVAECVKKVDGDLRGAILDAFELANQRVLALGTGAGTTLSVTEIQSGAAGPVLRSYHAGDSGVLVTGGRGKVKLNTIPHSPVGYGVEAGLIEPAEAIHHDDLNLVSNLVGLPDMRIEMGSLLQLHKFDAVVLGSDGLFDNLHLFEVADQARKGKLSEASENLVNLSRRRMTDPEPGEPSKPDDVAFILFRPRSAVLRSRS